MPPHISNQRCCQLLVHCVCCCVSLLTFGLALEKFLWLIKFEIRTAAASCVWCLEYIVYLYGKCAFVRSIKS